jgi:hypothetical protein
MRGACEGACCFWSPLSCLASLAFLVWRPSTRSCVQIIAGRWIGIPLCIGFGKPPVNHPGALPAVCVCGGRGRGNMAIDAAGARCPVEFRRMQASAAGKMPPLGIAKGKYRRGHPIHGAITGGSHATPPRFGLLRTACAPTSTQSHGFCAIWVCISSS